MFHLTSSLLQSLTFISPCFICCGSPKLTLPGQLNTVTITADAAFEWHKVTDGRSRSGTIYNEMVPILLFQSQNSCDTCHSTPQAVPTQHSACLRIICANNCQRNWHTDWKWHSFLFPLRLSLFDTPPPPPSRLPYSELNVTSHFQIWVVQLQSIVATRSKTYMPVRKHAT